MSRILTLLIAVAVVIGSVVLIKSVKESYKVLPAELTPKVATVPFEDWREFTSETGHFKVLLPSVPQHATENVVDPKSHQKLHYDMYVAEKNDGSTFMISLITYPDRIDSAESDRLLVKIVEEMHSSNPQNKLKRFQKNFFGDYAGIDFFIENQELRIEGKAFIVNQTLYLLTLVAKLEDYNQDEYKHFINTFQLNLPTSK